MAKKEKECEWCDGTGHCPDCYGCGQDDEEDKECEYCAGFGVCDMCEGSGKREKED